MIFSKTLRLLRNFSVFKKIPGAKKESIFRSPKPFINSQTTEAAPSIKHPIFEICNILGNEKLKTFANKSKAFFETDKTSSQSDRFFELCLLFMRTEDMKFIKDMQALEGGILDRVNQLKQDFVVKNTQKFQLPTVFENNAREMLRNSLGLRIMGNLQLKSEIRLDKNFQFLVQFQRVWRENESRLSPEDQAKLEIIYLLFMNYKLTESALGKSDSKDRLLEWKNLLPELFKSLNLYLFIKKLLSYSLENPKTSCFKDLTDSDFLMNTLSMLSSDSPETLNDFFSLLWELHNLIPFSPQLSLKVFLEIMKRKSVGREFSDKCTMFSVTLINSLSQNLGFVSKSDFSRILFLISKENSSRYNHMVTKNFWEQAVEEFPNKYKNAKNATQKGILYSLGKYGFISPRIRSEVFEVEFENFKKIEYQTINQELLDKYYGIMRSGVNLKVFTSEHFHVFYQQMQKISEKNPEILAKFNLEFAPSAIRLGYLDSEFWRFFFQNLDRSISEKEPNLFQIFFVLKSLQFISNGRFRFICEDFQAKHPDVFQILSEAVKKPNVQEIINRPLLKYYQQEIDHDSRSVNAKSSLLEETMSKCLNSLGTPFISQHCIEFMIVDFYLPIENIVVEVMGATHFVKSEGKNQEMTLLTDFKLNCLRELGYGLIIIDHDQEVMKGVSIEESFLKQYSEIINKKTESI